jgi:hypothetical protein
MSERNTNIVLRTGGTVAGEPVADLPPALIALLSHPVHHHDLRRLPGLRAAIRILRAELERGRGTPAPVPLPLPECAELLALLGSDRTID